jgi:glutaredoxin
MKIEIFTADWCQQCKPVKIMLEDFEHKVHNVDTPEGALESQSRGVRGLPTLFIDNKMIVGSDKCIEALNLCA